jgi:molybdopterin synthase catalytic subunit
MIELTEKPIDTTAVLSEAGDEYCGAVVLFVGTTRRWTRVDEESPTETDYLHYEAYREMALKQMQELENTARQRWPVRQVAMVHRLGRVEPTEPSVAVAVSCPHRGEAFEAARWLIDELKHQVPIWKREHYVQTGAEWIHPTNGSCNCGPHSTAKVGHHDQSEAVARSTDDLHDPNLAARSAARQQSKL